MREQQNIQAGMKGGLIKGGKATEVALDVQPVGLTTPVFTSLQLIDSELGCHDECDLSVCLPVNCCFR